MKRTKQCQGTDNVLLDSRVCLATFARLLEGASVPTIAKELELQG
jgi:hypothetical protein